VRKWPPVSARKLWENKKLRASVDGRNQAATMRGSSILGRFANIFEAALIAVTVLVSGAAAADPVTLRIGLQDDPDMLDPHRARTYVGRIVFAALCDKLVDTTPDLKFVPQLAESWSLSDDRKALTFKLRSGVKFHDGGTLDAAAVKYNLDRARTLPDSTRRSELASVDSVEVVDPQTVTLKLKRPDATLLAQLSDRAGMMISPKAAAASTDFALAPVCSGPYKFVQRIQQDRIVLERFPDYWNKGAYFFDRIVYFPIPDTTVRLSNLRAGSLDIVERVAPSDLSTISPDKSLAIVKSPGLGYSSVYVNLANGEAAKTPLGSDPRVRQALDLAIDRDAINQVVFEGLYNPSNQPFPPTSPYYSKAIPSPKRDVQKAQTLLKQAGVTTPLKAELMVGNSNINQQVGQMVQAMASEAGFDLKLRATEYATLIKEQAAGNFQLSLQAWSGRVDPDGNIHQFVTCKGNLNDMKYCNKEVDGFLNDAREAGEQSARIGLYDSALKILSSDLPVIYLYSEPRIFAMTKKLQGFVAHPDGMIRLENVKFGS
jgi:peptide/nickel transport system substrate-binding protein